MWWSFSSRWLLVGCVLWALTGCRKGGEKHEDKTAVRATLVLGAYTTPREAYGRILPAFVQKVSQEREQSVDVRESYLASGAQARAIVGGFEADVAALSLEADIDKLVKAGLITHDWKSGPYKGMVTESVVVIGVRPGNPKGIKEWADLARPGIEVLTPNVRTSGGAMWNVLAVYGAARRAGEDPEALLAKILKNVRIMDSSGRDSTLNFERGVGDAIITYENELLVQRAHGKEAEYVVPHSTILIQNPIAIVDVFSKKHGATELARYFLDYLWSEEAQLQFAQEGLRPVLPSTRERTAKQFARVEDLFTIEDLGGWSEIERQVFAAGALYERSLDKGRGAVR